jgi:glycosyltransferase involved in cell wall biosynthesis
MSIKKSIMRNKKLLIVLNVDWAFLSHRLDLALYAKTLNYEVTIAAMEERELGSKIRKYGFNFIKLPSTRSNTNIIDEIRVIYFLYNLYKTEKPDIIHHVAMKSVIYGSFATMFLKHPKIINAITGMGTVFIDKKNNLLSYLFITLSLRLTFDKKNTRVIMQNKDDFKFIERKNIVKKSNIFLIPGAGVNLEKFPFIKEKKDTNKVRFLLPARMLWDKGIKEYVEAARYMKLKYKGKVEFILAGNIDIHNKTVIPRNVLLKWNKEKNIKWIGFQNDIPSLISSANVVVLPSYQEGLPKSLIEACAIGRAIITTNVPGCRDVVDHGVNGLLVKVKDSESLINAMEVLTFNDKLRSLMGFKGRKKAEELFDLKKIIKSTIKTYEN